MVIAGVAAAAVWCKTRTSTNKLRHILACDTIRYGAASIAANFENEDRFKVIEDNETLVAVVADGHGSHQVSNFVSEHLPWELMYANEAERGTITSRIEDSFVRVDNAIREIVNDPGSQNPKIFCYEGSCAIAAIITRQRVIVANSGDSRALLIGQSATRDLVDCNMPCAESDDIPPKDCLWVSELHTADNPLEQMRLRSLHPLEKDVVHCRQKIVQVDSSTGGVLSTKWGACYVKGRLQPTRAFGDFYLKDRDVYCPPEMIDIIPVGREPALFTPPYIHVTPTLVEFDRVAGSYLVLGSDGLWDYCSPRMVRNVIASGSRQGRNPNQLAEDLIEAALEVASESSDVSIGDLKNMQRGFERRNIHDDITVVVLAL
jgi:pyruvate dehydrogenase phosphatase